MSWFTIFVVRVLRMMGASAMLLAGNGLTAKQLRAAGFTPQELVAGGLPVAELRNAGFTLLNLWFAGCSAQELHEAGFEITDICESRLFTAKQLFEDGFAADWLSKIYSANQLLLAGYPLTDLRSLYSIYDLRKAGVKACDFRMANCTAKELVNAGYPLIQIWMAGYNLVALKSAGMSAGNLLVELNASKESLLAAGFEVTEIELAMDDSVT